MDVPGLPDHERPALESLMRWYLAMGADAALDETSHDRFTEPGTIRPPASAPLLQTATPAPPRRELPAAAAPVEMPPPLEIASRAEALVAEAERLAAGTSTLIALRDAWAGFEGSTLAATASQMIFSGGTAGARVMIVNTAPGSDDERNGEAFSGPAGRLLDAMLAAIGLSRQSVYLANVIPWRPPGNRPPTPLESAVCLPFMRRHIALAGPALILCLGERPAQLLLGTREPLARLRGRWLTTGAADAPVKTAVTFSLEYLLSQPLQKRRAWADLLTVEKMLAELER